MSLCWYDAVDPSKRVETPWVAALRDHPGVVLRLGRATLRPDGRLGQKRVDTLLVADVVEAVYGSSPPADIVVVSGDEDLAPAVDVAIGRGARVHLVTVVGDDGARLGVSRHLRLSVTSELPVRIADLAPMAKSRARLFAQMAGIAPGALTAAADEGAGAADEMCDDDGGHDGQGQAGVLWDQPVLPGMPPDPARRAEDLDGPVPATPEGLVSAERLGLEERIQDGQVSRAYLAGRAYAIRWWSQTDPGLRDIEVRSMFDTHPHLPHRVDRGLLRYAGHHVGVGRGSRGNRLDVRAGFSHAVRRLAGVTSIDGLDVVATA